jgi:hypothetical protein
MQPCKEEQFNFFAEALVTALIFLMEIECIGGSSR